MGEEKTSADDNKIRLTSLVDDLVGRMKPVAEGKNLHFRYRVERISASVLAGSEETLFNALAELMKNAVDYTPEGGDVIFCARELMSNERESTLEFYVQDNGIGMSKEHMTELTESMASRDGVHGLDLVKREIESLKGTLSFESGTSMGTIARVILTLPVIDRVHNAPIPDMNRDIYSFKGKKILLAEDHPLNLDIAKTLLERVGFEVETAVDGQEAASLFARAEGGFDLIVMDIRMPVMDGIEATKVIRSSGIPGSETIPIIALTASAYEGDGRRSRAAGMNEHLLKPIDPARMYSVLSKYLYQK